MCDQQSLRSACAYAQSDQSLCLSLEYSMIVKLLTEHHLEFLSLKGDCTGSLSLHMSKCHIVGNLMHWLTALICTSTCYPVHTQDSICNNGTRRCKGNRVAPDQLVSRSQLIWIYTISVLCLRPRFLGDTVVPFPKSANSWGHTTTILYLLIVVQFPVVLSESFYGF